MDSISQLIQTARAIRAARGTDTLNLPFMEAAFDEAGHDLSECQIATVTYVVWFGSVLASGLTFSDHLQRLKLSPDCAMDMPLKARILTVMTQEELARVKAAEVDSQQDLLWTGTASALALAAVGCGLFILSRRAHLKTQAEAERRTAREQRRQARREARREARTAPEA